jgi:hypothetical protein
MTDRDQPSCGGIEANNGTLTPMANSKGVQNNKEATSQNMTVQKETNLRLGLDLS